MQMHRSSSYTSSEYSVASSNSSYLSKPLSNDYIKTHKNITFSFAENANTFQQGSLGDTDTYLTGTVHLNYQKACAVKNIFLQFKGVEKTSWYKAQARSKVVYTGERTLINQTNKIWEAFEETEEVTILDIPFKIQLPRNLPETIVTEIGSVRYVLRATVNTKGLLGTNSHIAKIYCPLKHTLLLDRTLSSPYKICGESMDGIEYTFLLPPHKNFNLGSHVTIPMILRFLRSGVVIERIEITLRTLMDFSCSQNEVEHVEQQVISIVIPHMEIRHVQLNDPRYPFGGCTQNINLFIPDKTKTTYSGKFINISHQLHIKFFMWGSESDFCVEEYVKVAHVSEVNGETSTLQPPFLSPDAAYKIKKVIVSDQVRVQEQPSVTHEPIEKIRSVIGCALEYDTEYRRTVAPFDNRFNEEYDTISQPQSLFGDILSKDFTSDTFANIQTPLSPPPYRRLLTRQPSTGSTYS
ncbi:13115_t:CDS:1 [Acaulospora morrowiae]|uniref:13115_t:CDS:1 n=1 Tax=Acaulospora morrowiae TaxID=94023 RepID=A0A9N9C7I6_9GLOM|nr:13115_t:CDS:1 [Acaulospora morrowiae]